MGLRIVSEEWQGGDAPSVSPDNYGDRLRKYIPAEAVGFWLAISGIIQSAGDDVPKLGLLWLFLVIGLVFTFAWTHRRTKEPGKPMARTQILISCVAFLVWVFASGGPLATSLSFYHPIYGSLLLITYTTAVSFIIPPEQ